MAHPFVVDEPNYDVVTEELAVTAYDPVCAGVRIDSPFLLLAVCEHDVSQLLAPCVRAKEPLHIRSRSIGRQNANGCEVSEEDCILDLGELVFQDLHIRTENTHMPEAEDRRSL